MSKKRRWNPSFAVTDEFLALPEIKQLCSEYKSAGFAIVVIMYTRLMHRKGCIGLLKNVDMVARELGIQKGRIIRIMDSSSAFVVDYKHGLFYIPRLRKMFKMPIMVDTEEAEDIMRNGNVYLGWCKKHSKMKCNNDIDSDTEKEDIEAVEECKDASLYDEENGKDSRNISQTFKKETTQNADNQTYLTKSKDKGKILRYKSMTSINKYRKQVSAFNVDADDYNFMRKIISILKGNICYCKRLGDTMPKNNSPGVKNRRISQNRNVLCKCENKRNGNKKPGDPPRMENTRLKNNKLCYTSQNLEAVSTASIDCSRLCRTIDIVALTILTTVEIILE